MRALKFIQIFSLALFVVGLANANRLETDDSQYGFASSDIAPVVFTCLNLDAGGNASVTTSCPGGVLTQQTFFQTQSTTVQVFDFRINTNISNFMLTLTGDGTFHSNGTAFGAFSVCTNVSHGDATEIVQCGPDPAASGVTVTPDLSVPSGNNVAKFTIPGSCEGCVFFAVEDQIAGTPPSIVHANIAANTPEPGSWILLASGLLILAVQRRRLTRLL